MAELGTAVRVDACRFCLLFVSVSLELARCCFANNVFDAGVFLSDWGAGKEVGAVCGAGAHLTNRLSLHRILAVGPSSSFLVYCCHMFFLDDALCFVWY